MRKKFCAASEGEKNSRKKEQKISKKSEKNAFTCGAVSNRNNRKVNFVRGSIVKKPLSKKAIFAPQVKGTFGFLAVRTLKFF